jgi:RpiB/LacA/LacB family sugar-phosphate isomerase
MTISIGADHAGFLLKDRIAEHLARTGHEVVDRGTASAESCDYPDFAVVVADDVVSGRARFGVLVCATGIGMSIAANKVRGIRAAHGTSVDEVRLARAHNDANILALGARFPGEDPLALVDAFLETAFEGGRHARRVAKIAAIEKDNCPEIETEGKDE